MLTMYFCFLKIVIYIILQKQNFSNNAIVFIFFSVKEIILIIILGLHSKIYIT